MRLKPLLTLALPVLLQAQASPEALDVVPANALAYAFARSPMMVSAKLQGLQQRLGIPLDLDVLAKAQAAFGLRSLPVDRRGVALVYLESPEREETRPLLFLAARDPKALLDQLKAKPTAEGIYTFKGPKGTCGAALREGWVALAEAKHLDALRKVAQGRDALRRSLGSLATWVEEGESALLFTPEGLWTLLNGIKREMTGPADTGQGENSPLVKMEQFMAEAQREVRFLGVRLDLDEHGTLTGKARLELQGGGQWINLGRGLPEPADRGMAGLTGTGAALAVGGSLPNAWLREIAPIPLPPLQGSEAQLEAREEARNRALNHLRGIHMTPAGEGSQQVLDVDDTESFLADLEAALAEEAKPDGPNKRWFLPPRRLRVGDREALQLAMPAKATPGGASAPEAAGNPYLTFLKEGPTTVAMLIGTQARPNADSLPALKDAPLVQVPGRHLPDRGHFFAFFDTHAATADQRAMLERMEARLTSEERATLPGVPDLPPFPAWGLSLLFGPEAWEFTGVLPWETQLGLRNEREVFQKAVVDRMRAINTLENAKRREKRGAAPKPRP
jgi:hypothetical protein